MSAAFQPERAFRAPRIYDGDFHKMKSASYVREVRVLLTNTKMLLADGSAKESSAAQLFLHIRSINSSEQRRFVEMRDADVT